MDKPIFNVVPQFMGLTTVQMNEGFTQLLYDFLTYDKEIPREIRALSDKLMRPGTWTDRESSIMMSTDKLNGVTSLVINSRMIASVIRFIKSYEDVDVEVWALVQALKNPHGCYENRFKKKEDSEEVPSHTW